MQEKDVLAIWNEGRGAHRHSVPATNSGRRKRFLDRFEKWANSRIEPEAITSCIDWGCGGGLTTKVMGQLYDYVYGVDVSAASVQDAQAYVKTLADIHRIPVDPAKWTRDMEPFKEDMDWVHCFHVIWHMPDYKYFCSVVDFWKKLNPRYITVQAKVGKSTRSASNYQATYWDALIMTWDAFKAPFEGYKIVQQGREPIPNKVVRERLPDVELGYLVLEKE